MINVTEQLRKESLLNSNYYVTANAVLKDGTVLSLKKEDFYIDGNGIVDSSDSGDFPVGVAIEKTATLALVNDDDRFTGYNFAGAKFTLFLNLQLSDRLETIRRGTFTVSKKPATSDEINLTLLDDMSKAEKEYSTNLIFPCSALEILEDACRQTGITLGDATFKNSDYQVTNKPENTTFRAVIGMVAALAGGNARIDENDNLRIITFEDDSNIITLREIPWYDINGKTILDIDGNEITTIIEQNGFFLDAIQDLTYDVDDILVTGVRYTNNDVEYKYGTDGYVITIDNKLLAGNEQKGVDLIGKELVGMRLRPFSCESIAIGYATFGDKVTFLDIKGNIYYSYLTDIDFGFSGSTSFSCNAKSMEELNANYPDSMQVEVDILRKDSEKKISAYDTKLKQINDLAANTLGFYYTEEVQEDGSVITYRHDKPTLDDSKVIYKTGVDGFFLSVDGGQTWKAGFDSNGDAVLNILYAIGIQSDWINTRGFTARDNDGDITFRIDAETGAVIVNATELTIKGKTPENVANAEVEKFISEVYSPQIKVLKAQIDGQIEAFFGNYIPDNDNEPASTWADDITKEKHLGDLFYIVNNEEYGGQAYRYAKIDGEYKWDYVKDTAVVKALADAANAQNTANAKKRIFGSEPIPPYDVDDLWVQGKTGDILRCQKAKAEGASYDENDWVRASKYTDDSAVTTFIKGVFSDTIENLQEQLDGKIQTWSQDTDPSLEWSETDEIPWTDINGNSILDIDGNEIIVVWEKGKYIHRGDLWQNTSDNTRWRYDGNKWVEQDVPDYLFDKIDGKAAVYFGQPTPPYNEGDLWVTSKENGEAAIKTAIRSRADGIFTDTDWIDFKYADKNDIDNAVKEYDTSLGQDEVFNKLTNGGEDQGIYIQDGKLYINANYILAGVLAGKFINAKGIKVIDNDGQTTLYIDDNGKVQLLATDFSLQGKTISEIADDSAKEAADGALSSSKEYTDSKATEVENKFNQEEIFNTLTNNGETQGIFLKDGKIYLNGQYAEWYGTTIKDTNGDITFKVDEKGKVTIGADTLAIGGKDITNVIESTAKEITDKELNNVIALNIILSAEYQGIPVDSSGNYTSFPQCSTSVQVLYGNQDVTSEATISYTMTNITGTWDSSTHVYTVSGLSADTGNVSFSAKYKDLTVSKKFSLSKIKQGEAGRQYMLEPSTTVIPKGNNSTITFNAYYRDGSSSSRSAYKGRFSIIEYMGAFINKRESSTSDESSRSFTPSGNANSTRIVCTLSSAGGSGTLAQVVVPIVSAPVTKSDIYNSLTDNGTRQLIAYYNEDLYINGEYIHANTIAAAALNVETLEAIAAKIAGFTLTKSSMYSNSRSSLNSTNAGVYIGTDGISAGQDANNWIKFSTGSCQISLGGMTMQKDSGKGCIAIKYGLMIHTNRASFTDGSGEFKIINIGTVSGSALAINSSNIVGKSTSAKRYKNHIRNLDYSEIKGLLDVPIVWFKYKPGVLVDGDPYIDRLIPGMYADDVHDVFPDGAVLNEDNEVEDWNIRTVVPAMLKLIQKQQERINKQQETIDSLVSRIEKLEKEI